MEKGTVKWFDGKKGYGFIALESGKDVFVHFSQIHMEGYKTLDEGMQVQLEVEESEKGLVAKNVTLAE